MSTRGWWVVFLSCSLLPCRQAHAGELSGDETRVPHGPEAPCAPLTKQHWYGWQTLATDGAGIGLIVVGGALQFRSPAAVTTASIGVGSLFLGGPIVHMAHGRWGIGVLDFGMRLTLPIIGGAYAGSQQCSGECGGPALIGLMIGLSPIWIDAAILAREDVPREFAHDDRVPRVPRALARLGVTELHPMTLPARRGLVVGLGGLF
jgi:hypothetical protein